MLRVIEDGSPDGMRRAIGQWLRMEAVLVNAADSAAGEIYPVHALAAAWERAKATRVVPVGADAQHIPAGVAGKVKVFIWHD